MAIQHLTIVLSLQWGRNFFVTEINITTRDNILKLEPLQWGRNFFVTEISIKKKTDKGRKCFNGAVTFSLRKSAWVICQSTTHVQLQWGRNFFVTEILVGLDKSAAVTTASMGP